MIFIIKFIKKLFNKADSDLQHSGKIVSQKQHHIKISNISINAINVLKHLNRAGFQAYLVGGSVRDLLLDKIPKDFDIATNATPAQMRKLFRNARIIGKRFKLVHIIFYNEIVEVATFRGNEASSTNQKVNERGMIVRDNVYGTMTEDAWRRDFSINAIYYNIANATLVDFADGMRDIQQRVIRLIGDPQMRYQEDPVRMLRAVRFAAKLNFTIEIATADAIYAMKHLLNHISEARLFDEVTKLYYCGAVHGAYNLLLKYELFAHLFEQTYIIMHSSKYPVEKFLNLAMQNTDLRIKQNKKVTIAFLFAILLWFPVKNLIKQLNKKHPLSVAIEQAINEVIATQNLVIIIPKRVTQIIRDIWLLQFRFSKRSGEKAYILLQHVRFRAAYDFLMFRSLVNDVNVELFNWWSTFQKVGVTDQDAMIKLFSKNRVV